MVLKDMKPRHSKLMWWRVFESPGRNDIIVLNQNVKKTYRTFKLNLKNICKVLFFRCRKGVLYYHVLSS